MNAGNPQIKEMHRIYECLTGREVALDMMRESMWFLFMKRFDAEDLRTVIEFRKRGIFAGNRHEASLKFSNIIGQLDFFEEDLAEARARNRPKMPATMTVRTGNTERIVANPNTEDASKTVGAVLQASEFVNKLKAWRMTQ